MLLQRKFGGGVVMVQDGERRQGCRLAPGEGTRDLVQVVVDAMLDARVARTINDRVEIRFSAPCK